MMKSYILKTDYKMLTTTGLSVRSFTICLCILFFSTTSHLQAQPSALDNTRKYIQNNWKNVVHVHTFDSGTLIGLPLPYSVPGSGSNFQEMYYWDTYFTNVGLLQDGQVQQAKNNIYDMLYLVERYGFMPNGNRTFYLVRSQSPYLSMMVKDVYVVTKDKDWLMKALPLLEKEYHFWMTKRITATGLNHYSGNMADDKRKLGMFAAADKRLGITKRLPSLSVNDSLAYGGHFIAECESGWDFTPRFNSQCSNYLPVDLNCNLYMYETNFSYFYKEIHQQSKVNWLLVATRRKERMSKYLMCRKDDLFYDYNYITKTLSPVLSAAIFNLLWSGVASTQQAVAIHQQLNRLEAAHGIAACEQSARPTNYQWDYPNGWANLQYVAIKGLDKYGYKQAAKRLAEKYAVMVATHFSITKNLWEKYNVSDGSLKATNEYGLPPLMGWTAGVFSFCYNYMQTGEPNKP